MMLIFFYDKIKKWCIMNLEMTRRQNYFLKTLLNRRGFSFFCIYKNINKFIKTS
jgi:hypothetical protein